MARPCKQRYIASVPSPTDFCPRSTPAGAGASLILAADELEALRLADVEGLSQEEGAARMNVSRPTFGRILERAHHTVATALVEGRLLKIGGGEVIATQMRHLRCRQCRRDWHVPRAVASSFRCPRCRE